MKVIPGQTFTRFTTGDLACCVCAVPGTKEVWTNERSERYLSCWHVRQGTRERVRGSGQNLLKVEKVKVRCSNVMVCKMYVDEVDFPRSPP